MIERKPWPRNRWRISSSMLLPLRCLCLLFGIRREEAGGGSGDGCLL